MEICKERCLCCLSVSQSLLFVYRLVNPLRRQRLDPLRSLGLNLLCARCRPASGTIWNDGEDRVKPEACSCGWRETKEESQRKREQQKIYGANLLGGNVGFYVLQPVGQLKWLLCHVTVVGADFYQRHVPSAHCQRCCPITAITSFLSRVSPQLSNHTNYVIIIVSQQPDYVI